MFLLVYLGGDVQVKV